MAPKPTTTKASAGVSDFLRKRHQQQRAKQKSIGSSGRRRRPRASSLDSSSTRPEDFQIETTATTTPTIPAKENSENGQASLFSPTTIDSPDLVRIKTVAATSKPQNDTTHQRRCRHRDSFSLDNDEQDSLAYPFGSPRRKESTKRTINSTRDATISKKSGNHKEMGTKHGQAVPKEKASEEVKTKTVESKGTKQSNAARSKDVSACTKGAADLSAALCAPQRELTSTQIPNKAKEVPVGSKGARDNDLPADFKKSVKSDQSSNGALVDSATAVEVKDGTHADESFSETSSPTKRPALTPKVLLSHAAIADAEPTKMDENIGEWSCTKCTFKNNNGVKRCGMCGGRRPPCETAGIVLSQRSSNTPKSSPSSHPVGRRLHRSSQSLDTSPGDSSSSSTRTTTKKRQRSASGKRSQSPAKKKKKAANKSRRSSAARRESDDSTAVACPDSENVNLSAPDESIAAEPIQRGQVVADNKPNTLLNEESTLGASETARQLQSTSHETEQNKNPIPEEIEPLEEKKQALDSPQSTLPVEHDKRPHPSEHEHEMETEDASDFGERTPPVEQHEQLHSSENKGETETITSLRAENQSLREQVESLKQEVAQLRSSHQSLLDEFFAKSIQSLATVKDDFLRQAFAVARDEDKTLSLGSASQTQQPQGATGKVPELNVDQDNLSPVQSPDVGRNKVRDAFVGLETSPNAHSSQKIGSPIFPPPAETGASPEVSLQKNSYGHLGDNPSVAMLMDTSSQRSENLPPPSLDEMNTPNRRASSQATTETNGGDGLRSSSQELSSPANSTQTMDPGALNKVRGKEIDSSTPTKDDQCENGTIDKSPKQPMQLSQTVSPPSGGQANAYGPPSPANSTQTMDPTLLKRSAAFESQWGKSITPSIGRQGTDGFDSESKSNRPSAKPSMLPPSIVRIERCSASSREELDQSALPSHNMGNGNGSNLTDNTPLSPHEVPTPLSRTHHSPLANLQQTRPPNRVSSPTLMGPPSNRNKDPLLGNSTNRRSSATWTSNAQSKSFWSHLERTSGSTSGPAQRSHSSLNGPNTWVTSSRPGKEQPPKKPPSKPGNIWDGSQDTFPNVKYQETVRCKAKRQGLPCHDCPDCKEFYDFMRKTGNLSSQDGFLMEHSRHRAQFTPPETPAGFWEIEFADEQRAAAELAEKN